MSPSHAKDSLSHGRKPLPGRLQPVVNDFLYTEALTRFARALGAARSGDITSVRTEVGQLARLCDALMAAKNEYWVTEVEVSRLAVSAWTALALGKKMTPSTLHTQR